jgi:iron complex transport system substrate-binding protein
MKRYIAIVFAILLLSPFLSGTSSGEESRQLRVVSLAPSSTEILFALGLDDEIVGVSQFCDFPQKASTKERIGTFSDPNIEKIISLKPDIVFCTALEQAPAITKMQQLGLKVCVSDPSNMEELFASIREMGKLVHREARAESLISEMNSGIDNVRNSVSNIPKENRPKVFIEIWHSPLMTAGKGSIVDELVTIAGGANIAYDTRIPYSSFSSEEVVRRDPDCIILTYMQRGDSLNAVSSRLGWGNISAVKNRRIYNDIDSSLLLRPGPRIVDGLRKLHKRIYP